MLSRVDSFLQVVMFSLVCLITCILPLLSVIYMTAKAKTGVHIEGFSVGSGDRRCRTYLKLAIRHCP